MTNPTAQERAENLLWNTVRAAVSRNGTISDDDVNIVIKRIAAEMDAYAEEKVKESHRNSSYTQGIKEEREACAKVAENYCYENKTEEGASRALAIRDAIRSRGEA